MSTVWRMINDSMLQQGDVLNGCAIPIVQSDFRYNSEESEIEVEIRRLIVATQSCDLENNKAPYVALCTVYTLLEFRETNSSFTRKEECENVRRGKVEGLHMLPSPTEPEDNQQAFIVDFRMIVSLPIEYLKSHASEIGERSRLNSPFVEHYSQAFARFFMRVGLPSQIPPYK